MGYRSDVMALVYPLGGEHNLLNYDKLKTLMNTTFKDVFEAWGDDYFTWDDHHRVLKFAANSVKWYDSYLDQGGVDRGANTTPGNKKGGLSNIIEKSLGSVAKSGTSAINAVLAPGEKVRGRGLVFAATPASDFVCGTLQMASGMNLHVFTTGRGTPYGLAAVPVIKVATRSDLAKRWNDLIDLDAGPIATGEKTIEQVGWELFQLMLDVASGRKQVWADKWGLHNDLTLFNPAPVT